MSVGQGSILVQQKREGVWTYVVLAATFTTNLAADTPVPGLFFTPMANRMYDIEGKFLLRTSIITTGPQPGIIWPVAGVADNAAYMLESMTATTGAQRWFTGTGTASIPSGSGPSAVTSFICRIYGILITDAAIAGPFQITLRSEIAGSNVSIMPGSFIKFREY